MTDSPPPRPTAVRFDNGLVLTGPAPPPAWERMKHLLGDAPEPAFHAAYWRHRADYDRGTLSGRAYWTAVARDLNPSLATTALDALLDADTALWTQPNRPMIDWAARLQSRGLRTGILSNLGDAMEAGVRAHCPWLARFDHLTFSHRLHLLKPDSAIYRHAAQGLGLAPDQILFIDDRADNVEGARTAGLQALLYTDNAHFLQAMAAPHLASLL